jgi:hypothetical protein
MLTIEGKSGANSSRRRWRLRRFDVVGPVRRGLVASSGTCTPVLKAAVRCIFVPDVVNRGNSNRGWEFVPEMCFRALAQIWGNECIANCLAFRMVTWS